MNDPKLEQYLASLDKALGPISISERADIVTEIKSHILDSMERNPNQGLGQTLAALGEPEAVANRYLLERGLKPGKAAKTPMVKWLTIGFLGTVGMVLLFTIALMWKFSPMVKIDETNERVTLLGGLIDINGEEGSVKIGDSLIDGKFQEYSSSKDLTNSTVKEIRFLFKNGKIHVTSSEDKVVRWDCKSGGISTRSQISEKNNQLLFDFEGMGGVKCDLHVPKHVSFQLEGTNGKIEFEKPQFPVSVKLMNGKVDIEQDKTKSYKFEAEVRNGKVDGLVSSTAPDAILIKLSLMNGKVEAH